MDSRPVQACVAYAWMGTAVGMQLLPGFDARRGLLTGMLCLSALYVAFAGAVRHANRTTWLGVAVGVLGLCSAALSASPSWALMGVAYAGLLVIAIAASSMALAQSPCVSPRVVVMLGILLPVALACFKAAATVYASYLTRIPMSYPEPLRDFANIRFLNQFQTWTLPFLSAALALPWASRRMRPRFWYGLVFVIGMFFWALYWRSSGRGTGYATALATLFGALLMGRAGRRHLLRMLLLAAAGYLASLVMFGAGSGHLGSSESPGRLYLWSIALTQLTAHPWLGIGAMQFAALDNGVASHPHDVLLQWAVEWGLPAALLACPVIAARLLRWIRFAYAASHARDSGEPPAERNTLIVAITCSLVAAALHALVSGVVVMPISQCMLVVVIGLAAAVYQKLEPTVAPVVRHSCQWSGWLTCGVMCLAAAYVAIFTLRDYQTRVSSPSDFSAAHIRNAYQPRYWSDGTLVDFVKKSKDK